jgi:very-long-chain enoyl-CoA reductase
LALSQRTYNALSYGGAALFFSALIDWTKPGLAKVAVLWVLHFLRRTAESLWVHRFSGRVVGPADYLIEYAYYWGFGVWIALSLGRDSYEPVSFAKYAVGLSLFAVGQIGNTWAHQKLRALRASSGEKAKRLPTGGLFSLVACPHYLFEITTWAGFAVLSWTLSSAVFFLVGACILVSYAWSRHKSYQKDFDGREGRPLYPQSRRALIPFVL